MREIHGQIETNEAYKLFFANMNFYLERQLLKATPLIPQTYNFFFPSALLRELGSLC